MALNKNLSFTIHTSAGQLHENWDTVAKNNVFLSTAYLAVLQQSAPGNMQCHFVGLYANGLLCGVAIIQYIDLSQINTFAKEVKTVSLKQYLFKKYSSHILVIGNNTLTGQNAYVLSNEIKEHDALCLLKQALYSLKKHYHKKGIGINLLATKDFNKNEFPDFEAAGFKGFYQFCTQPNMIFRVREYWSDTDAYVADMNTKYRTQYNRARKKAEGISKRKLELAEIELNECRIHELYLTVAANAPFNTFFLPEGHFYTFKKQLRDNFLFYGYFIDEKLVGFNTLIKNGDDIDTYFLGYDAFIQKDKMLYLNMLYDMASYAIKKRFKHVIFARSAMEIKSSVGAKAEEVYGIMKHTNPIINLFMHRLFPYFDPKIEWKERNPFK